MKEINQQDKKKCKILLKKKKIFLKLNLMILKYLEKNKNKNKINPTKKNMSKMLDLLHTKL